MTLLNMANGEAPGAAAAPTAIAAKASSRKVADPSTSASEARVLRSDTKALRDTLSGQAMEVEFLLRPALSDAAALTEAMESVAAALRFDDELGELAAAHEMSKGRLFQALLEELRQAGTDHAQLDNSGEKQRYARTNYREEFGPEEWARMATSADSLRKLVRIKVADDNDLKTARAGLVICSSFFDGLQELARLRSVAQTFEVLQELQALIA